jgi:iron complex outermembrane receptor protein
MTRHSSNPAATFLRLALVALLGLVGITAVNAAAAATERSFDLPADAAERSIKRFSEQAELEVFYPSSVAAGLRTRPVKGRMTPRAALDAMLNGTGLTVVQDKTTGAFSVRRTDASASPPRRASMAAGNENGEMPSAAPAASASRTATGTGTITGRVLNADTRQYLRSAVVAVSGTALSTLTEAGGAYRLGNVPAGNVQLAVIFTGLNPATANVQVTAGQTVVHDFTLSAGAEGDIVKLGAFRVVTEREGNFKAIQEQKSALEIKNVVATDAFGDVSEGNVGEFLKLMPGVMLDYVDADVRTVSIGGLDPKYSLIMMDGMPVASAGSSSIATGRAFEFEQLSIKSIETVELSKTPTPDVAGSALGGVVNLRSKGAFDRSGRQIRWSTALEMNSHNLTLKRTPGPNDRKNYKFNPSYSLEYSDVFREKLGVIAGVSFTRTLVEQNIVSLGFARDTDTTNNATEIPRFNFVQLTDAPKTTDRGNYHLRLDYKLSPDLSVWGRIDYSTYLARNFRRDINISPTSAVMNDPTVPYSLDSQTGISSVAVRSGFSFVKHGSTTTTVGGASYKRGNFRADAQVGLSRAVSERDDLKYGFAESGDVMLTGLGLRLSRPNAGTGGFDVTQISGADWRDPNSYTTPADPVFKGDVHSKDQRWTGKADFRYTWDRGPLPVVFKWGGDVSEKIYHVMSAGSGDVPYIYLGPDRVAGSGDERWPIEPNFRIRNLHGGNVQGIFVPDRFVIARELGAHPERFTPPAEAGVLQRLLRQHYDVKEQIDSLYLQAITKVTPKFDLAPGVRLERTRSIGIGPLDEGDAHARRLLTGSSTGAVDVNSVAYIQARYGSSKLSNNSNYHTWLKYLHAVYRFSDQFVARASFNDSITRPNLNNLAASAVISETSVPPSANIPNPDLKPERGRNVFGSLEYYFPKGRGFLTLSGARRDITNLIRSRTVDLAANEDFIFGGENFAGYRVTTVDNVGQAHLSSLELSYRQNLTFLPGIWKSFSVFGNFTRLHYDNYDNFLRPEMMGSGGFSFDRKAVSLRWNAVWVPKFRTAAVGTDGWSSSAGERLQHDLQFGFRFSRYASLYVNGRNVFNQIISNALSYQDRHIKSNFNDYGVVWTFGVRGTF